MNAAWFERFGPAAEVIQVGEWPTPQPADDEVLVRLETSGVNPSDVKKRAGSFAQLLDDGPIIPHSDGAGTIEAVGTGVPRSRIGERVWVYQAQFERRFGTAAEYVALPAVRAVTLPARAGFDVGACLGIPAMTAHRCVFADGPVEGQTMLVTGGGGRVGFYAVQFASQAGARVIATAGNARSEADALRAGAAAVVDHRSRQFVAAVRDHCPAGKVDRVVDVEFGASLPHVLDLIRVGGVIATYASTRVPQPTVPFFRVLYLDLTIHFVIVYAMPEQAKQQAAADINAKLERGELQHRVAERLPLTETARAHQLIEAGGAGGCVIVECR